MWMEGWKAERHIEERGNTRSKPLKRSHAEKNFARTAFPDIQPATFRESEWPRGEARAVDPFTAAAPTTSDAASEPAIKAMMQPSFRKTGHHSALKSTT